MSISVSTPHLTSNAQKYIQDCLDTNWISSRGKYIDLFQMAFEKKFGVKNSLCVCNGTSALHLALLSLGISSEDEVIVPNFTFAAPINMVLQVGANPIIVDSDKETWNISTQAIINSITDKTKAIIIVDVFGNPFNLKELKSKIPDSVKIIKDCAESLGAKIGNSYVGSESDISTFSFYANKIITTGEGGLICFKDENLFKKAKTIMNHGFSGKADYDHVELGHNFRMTNIQAAIGLSQIESYDYLLEKRHFVMETYFRELKELNLTFQKIDNNSYCAPWFFNLCFETKEIKEKVKESLTNNKIETKDFFRPLSSVELYKKYSNNVQEDFYGLFEKGLMLPTSSSLSRDDILKVSETIRRVI